MKLDERNIGLIVEKVVEKLVGDNRGGRAPAQSSAPKSRPSTFRSRGDAGIFENIDDAIKAAVQAQRDLSDCTLKTRDAMIQAMRDISREHNEDLSHQAVQETGLGRVDDKINKNLLVIEKCPGTEVLRPVAVSGDDGLTLTERAPFGVIAAITPCTNATETILCNAIGMIAGGNSVVFNVHPASKATNANHVTLLNEACVAAGGPENLMTMVREPTIESAGVLMKHPDTRLVVVTGGGAVVKAAMHSGKRAIAAGPGNPPVVVDETADLKQAGKGIVLGAGLDCNIVCIAEKEIIAVTDIADMLKREMKENKAVEITGRDIQKLEKLLITSDNHVNRDFIGKRPSLILKEIGIRCDEDTRIVICEVKDEMHPFVQHELLMPVIAMLRVPNVDEGIAMARRVEHNFRHTAVMYSTNIAALHKMARVMDCSIFVKNAPSYSGIGLGGEGYTSFTIASPTGEGLTNATHFTRERRCTLKDYFRIV
ncbi:MAG: aldehyde dehydrogenase EutE [Deltaproteobacteria bacterium CG2_30_63_29]|nr:MAG: aldehyde dehydrogenase EutE [Deltaproteobacteria bacterium CG2_30_63_29]PJB34088.1 MAG: aldehyde dehydrogenase EutE [Deltaproteobacteria bacterium CG_4_9_14_3_um_filter_63_12]